ncbi:MAG: Trk system potassium transporter TrkA [Oscillospiraceae bacterium]|nr:Trk system potassium transporter TrkA [Oscillospiraceae bacterium]
MKIVIVGCGKVGSSLAENLSCDKQYDVTIIDLRESITRSLENYYDVIAITGNCLSVDVLDEANMSDTTIFIATTDSDEVNILSCLIARKKGAKHCVSRVRSTDYSKQLVFMREDLGISMMVNPDLTAASDISRILRYPRAIKIESFSRGRVDLIELRITEDNILANRTLIELSKKLKIDILICAVQRGDDVFIPNGNTMILPDDRIHLTASHTEIVKFFRAISDVYRSKSIKSVLIIGGGRVAYHLALQLVRQGTNRIKIIEVNEERCKVLSEKLKKVEISCGDGTDQRILEEEGIDSFDAFLALTGIDEENIILSLYAKKRGIKKVITKINRLSLLDIAESFGLESIVSPKAITVNTILQYVRARKNSNGSGIITLYRLLSERLEALEFVIKKNESYVGVPLKDLKFRNNIIIASILRGNQHIVPKGDDFLMINDSVVVITAHKGMNDINEIFG